jgi:hypothetical protein
MELVNQFQFFYTMYIAYCYPLMLSVMVFAKVITFLKSFKITF